jgi:DNA-binding response OmpR family regulator
MSKTILLIDDDQDHLDLLKLAIKQVDASLSCISFVYPDDALKMLTNFSELPSSIFIDFNLPRKEGIECLYEIRKNKRYENIKVVMYAAKVPAVVREALKEAGADVVFQKPGKLSDYKAIIEGIITP